MGGGIIFGIIVSTFGKQTEILYKSFMNMCENTGALHYSLSWPLKANIIWTHSIMVFIKRLISKQIKCTHLHILICQDFEAGHGL